MCPLARGRTTSGVITITYNQELGGNPTANSKTIVMAPDIPQFISAIHKRYH
jgi:hypothetical protein